MSTEMRAADRRRVTIVDIAAAVGVSKGTVSSALNDRPGVSDDTRRRIRAVADDLGWRPSIAARALSGHTVAACGLVLNRPARTLAVEPFFMELISGIEIGFSWRGIGLMLQVADTVEEETACYRRWAAEQRVDGVLVTDLRVDDPRIAVLQELSLPAVVIGEPGHTGTIPVVWNDDGEAMREAVDYLVALGHRRMAHIAGPPQFVHTTVRSRSFAECLASGPAIGVTETTDYSGEDGARATRRVLSDPERPTALIYDNDVMALAGVGVAQELGLSVPDDVSIVAWDDSMLCRLVHPPLTTLSRDVVAHGTAAALHLLDLVALGSVGDRQVPSAGLVARASTAPRRVPGVRAPTHVSRSRPRRP